MNKDDYDFLYHFLLVKSGLALTQDKDYLIESRLTSVARENRLASVDDLIPLLRTETHKEIERQVIEAMATHETFFFRDLKPFTTFQQAILPTLMAKRQAQKTIRIWCAACSSGQEPYSLAMILADAEAQLAGWQVDLIGTDLCKVTIDKAKEGVYSQFEVQRGLPVRYLVKYFKQVGERWHIDPRLKDKVQYSLFNLLDDSKALGQFDLIFCRNVLIYFDLSTKIKVLADLNHQLAEDGYLCLGGAETVMGISHDFTPSSTAIGMYQKESAQPS